MNHNSVIKLAVKIAGIYVIAQTILLLPSLILVLNSLIKGGSAEAAVATVASFVMLLVLAVALIMTKCNKGGEKDGIHQLEGDIKTVALAVAAIIIFALALDDLPVLIGQLVFALTTPQQMIVVNGANAFTLSLQLIGKVVVMALGALIFFQAKPIAKFIK